MKLNLSDFARKSQFPLMLMLSGLPIPVLMVMGLAPDALHALAVLLPACLLLCLLCMTLPGKIRVAADLLGCAALAALSLRLLPVHESFFLLAVPLLCCALLVYSLQFAAWPREQEIAFGWYAFGVVIHLFAQFFLYVSQKTASGSWGRAALPLTAAFALFLLLVLLSMNRSTMTGASLGRQRVPPSMRQKNSTVTIVLLGAALLIAGIPAIIQTVESVFSFALRTVGRILSFIAGLLESEAPTGGGGAGGAQAMPYAEVQEPSLLALILEKILTVIVLAVLACMALLLLRELLNKLFSLIRRIRARIAAYMTVASQDYVDEITDTREEGGEASGSLLARLRSRMAMVNARGLTPTERIRHRYRLLLRRRPDWAGSKTARENLPPETAALYEAARYSGREATQQDADQFTQDTKRMVGKSS